MRLVFAFLFGLIVLTSSGPVVAQQPAGLSEVIFSAATCGADSDTTLTALLTKDCLLTSVIVTVGTETGAAVLSCSTQVSFDSVTWITNSLAQVTSAGTTTPVLYTPNSTTAANRSFKWLRVKLNEIPATGTFESIKVSVFRQFYQNPKLISNW